MEYIKLESALKILDSVMSDEGIKHKGKAIRKRLNELPKEDVEKVVKCKECRYFTDIDEYGMCDLFDDGTHANCKKDDFCSRGERKEGDPNASNSQIS